MAATASTNLQPFLERLSLRSVLTDQERRAILGLPGRARQVRANHDFVALGERVDHVSLIVAGLVGRFEQNGEGARQITAIHVPGDMADLHSVVQPRATSALQALSVATILQIPHAALRSATARYPAIAEILWRDCMADAAILSQWIVNVGRRDAKARIAHLLCELAFRLGAPVGHGSFSFPFQVTQMQLADATGLTSVHVNRVLKSLREGGLAEVGRLEVTVRDWDRLRAAGEFNPNYLQADIKPHERLRIVQSSHAVT
ncbi:Crp/Fnr family transcriptional regulator [Sphingobium sp. TKS]|uniref:Crp/Fnr family transcriptional regulator n=1 Tax=Sphingobium sp. TKS TaxID=1315974 RepID=UPI00076FE8D0|nr:Crp/Fnr family transcriptional regulator [Sphingobium sp. TKS]AMK26287.1 putative Crp/Fnr family transcriptional regulator [Sphingobium sp. TKS]